MALTEQDALTEEVIASFAAANPRLREITGSLVKHLHAFIREVGLTEEEWATAIKFLTRTGQISDASRQEFVLLSDVLGASMATIAVNHPAEGKITESTVLGPFFVEGSPAYENGDDLSNGASGEPCYLHGTVRSVTGKPVPGALLEIWQSDDQGFYDVQYSGLDKPQGRGHLYSDAEGRYWFWSVHPEAYPIPDDGPVGELLAAAGRGPMRPAHVHFKVSAPGHRTLTTHIFASGGSYLDSDAVFGVKPSLIVDFTRHEPGTAPDGREIGTQYYSASFDIVLADTS
jgi:hydroxyquinol 1,2-dioxygenase